ncbi:M23 family metallopeptidase [Streptomyces polygonati]|uniref:M23 family metallopeptidase n=1 Tax=Streptomyces polygonati TaxID=1617087 RepID=A0ABV8HLV4_9ACTN
MTESPLPGYTPDYDAYGYDAYSTGAYQTVGTAFADDATGTYGYIPQQAQHDQRYETHETYEPSQQPQAQPQYQAQQVYGYGDNTTYGYTGYDTGYDQTGTYAAYDPYAYGDGAAPTTAGTGAGTYYDTGTYDTSALWQDPQPQQVQPQADWDSGAYPAYGYGYGYDASGDTGVYEQVRPDYGYQPAPDEAAPAHQPEPMPQPEPEPHSHPVRDLADQLIDDVEMFTAEFATVRDTEPERHDYAADGYGDGEPVARSRRRKPAKRSALLTVAVPSVAVMGVAAVGAAAVAGVGMAQDAPKAQADGQKEGAVNTPAPTTQLDRQLAGVSRDATDFADRASRTQERIDLKDRQEAAKKAAQVAAARKEALRPKFLLPVTQKGLSAYFGQAGVNWMALHTGIDFPVQVGTPVMAATDGTVRTQWNSSYGNMAIVTAADGTETWYCHLSSTKIRSGKVKAGEVIAYSGNTGNTTGPHLHFEVRPDGGAPIDPLPWLLAHGLDPR